MTIYPNKGIFIDRDGVITELERYDENNPSFICKIQQIKFIEGTFEALQLLKQKGYKIIIIGNCPQIARGLVTENRMKKLIQYIKNELRKNDADFDDYFYCPHHPTKGKGRYKIDCGCRKPKCGMITDASKKHKINLKESYVVGDRTGDIKAGKLAGCKTIGVKTGYGCKDPYNDSTPDFMVENLLEAVKIIKGD